MNNAQKIILVGVNWIAFSLLVKFFIFSEIVKFGIKDQVSLRHKNDVRDIYLKIPFPLNFSIYFFNVTNPMQVQEGAKPILHEVGPYSYDEYVEKLDVVDNEADDSLTYSPYSAFYFNQEISGNLKDDDYVTILNPLIVGMVNMVAKDSPALLSIVNKAITEIFNNPSSIYLTARVKDILFDGVEINCRAKEFAAKAVCSQIKQQMPGLKTKSEKIYLFSLFGPRNATLGKRTKVIRGISNFKDVGKLVEVDGMKELTLWGTPECNRYKGTDGWVFPPLTKGNQSLFTFSGELCRNVEAYYVNSTEMYGLAVNRYEADLGDMEHNEKDKCYCDTPTTCRKKGVMDLTKCMGVPIMATFPHFYKTHESYLEEVEGLSPNHDEHCLYLLFEPMLAVPLEAKKRMQLNMEISANSKITIMDKLPTALHPIFWLEEGLILEGPLLNKIKNVFLLMRISGILLWVSIFIGFLITIVGAYLFFKNKKQFKVTPVHSSQKEDNLKYFNENSNNLKSKRGSVNHSMSGHEFDKYQVDK